MAARSSAILVALVGLGAAAALGMKGHKTVPGRGPSDAQLAQLAGEIELRLRDARSTAEARAQTLSEVTSYNIGTDEATIKDQLTRELKFNVKQGETIELGQVFKKDGRQVVLLRLPPSMTMSLPLGKPGPHVMHEKDKLIFAQVNQVTVADPKIAAELTGSVAVSEEVPLTDFVDKLDKLGTAASLEVDGEPILRGTREPVAGATFLPSPQVGEHVKIVAEVLPATKERDLRLLGGAAVLALLSLIVAVVVWRKAPAVVPMATGTTGVVPPVNPAGSGPRFTPAEAQQLGVAHTEVSEAEVPRMGTGTRPGSRMPTGDSREKSGATAQPGRFGRYKLVKALGAGGMAEVYLATVSGEAGFEKQVALKIMHANLAMQEKVVDLFLDEARIVSRLTHPNIVQISDLGKDGQDYFIAMEYIDGWDLDKLVRSVRARGEQVPVRVGLTILRKICDGLHAAHTAMDVEGKPLELVHRDVKAENVLISRSGAVKVGDFGIAKANQQVHKTQLGELKGTAAYMAPEHRTGQAVDKRADIYGVGAIAYEVLTGNEVNLDLAMLAHLGREGWPHLPPPTSVRTDLPPELDDIVFKALEYEKDARYPTCEKFEEALDAVCTRYGLTASDKVVAQWVESVIANAPPSSATTAPGAQGVA